MNMKKKELIELNLMQKRNEAFTYVPKCYETIIATISCLFHRKLSTVTQTGSQKCPR